MSKTRLFLFLAVALTAEAAGYALISRGMKEVGEIHLLSLPPFLPILHDVLTNTDFLSGIAMQSIYFFIFLGLLRKADLSVVVPSTALGYLLDGLFARFYLHEIVSPLRWVGIGTVVIGVYLIGKSHAIEKR